MKKILYLLLFVFSSAIGQLQLPYAYKNINVIPHAVDYYYYNSSTTPYTNTAQVISQVTSGLRYIGQTFNVDKVEYWFKDGILDVNLIAKGGVSNINSLGGVVIASPTTVQVLKFNGTNWVNAVLVAGDIPVLNYIPLAGSSSITGNLYNSSSSTFYVGKIKAFAEYLSNAAVNISYLNSQAPTVASIYNSSFASYSSETEGVVSMTTGSGVNVRSFRVATSQPFEFTGQDVRYFADYSGTYTTRSLVDKAYVDVQVATKENSLGNPATNGHILSSTTAGVRSWIAPPSGGGVTSVFSRTGVVVAQSGDYNTSQVTENTNLYFSNARAQSAISVTPPLTYTGGVLGIQLATASQGGALSNTNQDIAGVKDFKAGVQLTGGIKDANYNQMLSVGASFSAVNSLYINNAATGASPSLGVQGSDANIGLSLLPQGTGVLYIGGSGGLKVNTLAGTDFRVLEADALGNVTATRRLNRTLAVTTTTVGRNTVGETDFGSFTIPANTLTTDGDAINIELSGFSNVVGQYSLKIYFNGVLVSENISSGVSAFINPSSTVRIIRKSLSTAIAMAFVSGNGSQNITSQTILSSLDFTTAIVAKGAIYSSGASGGTINATHSRVTFEPAP